MMMRVQVRTLLSCPLNTQPVIQYPYISVQKVCRTTVDVSVHDYYCVTGPGNSRVSRVPKNVPPV